MSTHTSASKNVIHEALQKLRSILEKNEQKRVLVIGDVMLDVFISGITNRISPEADVLILKEETRTEYLGGAANTAHNVASLNAKTTLVGVIGNDTQGTLLQKLTLENNIDSKLIVENGFITTTKTRAVGPQGHLLRIDTESVLPISKKTEEKIITSIKKLPPHDVVVISDYAKGVLTERVIETIKTKYPPKQIFVDTKPSRIHLYRDIGLMKLNVQETKDVTDITVSSKKDTETALQAIHKLTNSSVVITRGSKGLTAFDHITNCIHHVAPIKTKPKDVVGAGDTTLAVLALMYAHKEELLYNAHVANYVASKAVAKEGTTALSYKELFTDESL